MTAAGGHGLGGEMVVGLAKFTVLLIGLLPPLNGWWQESLGERNLRFPQNAASLRPLRESCSHPLHYS
jgi:hypothetical protein